MRYQVFGMKPTAPIIEFINIEEREKYNKSKKKQKNKRYGFNK